MTPIVDPGNGNSMQKSVIEWNVLDQFLAFRKPGGADPRRRIITVYLDSTPLLMEAIKTAIRALEWTSLTKAAHSLKSSSMNVGAGELGSICAELERAGKTGSIIDEAKTIVDRLETQYAAVTAALQDALQHMDK